MPTISHCLIARPCGKQREAGFTLIELMIIVTMLGIFSMIAVPSFTKFIADNRTQSLNNEMLSLLQFARSTAVERRILVRVCKEEGQWTVKTECLDSSDTLRSLSLPNGASISSSAEELTFRYNGTGTEAVLMTCHDEQAENGYTIDVKLSGSIRTWPRGKNGPGNNDQMTTCTYQSPQGGDDESQG